MSLRLSQLKESDSAFVNRFSGLGPQLGSTSAFTPSLKASNGAGVTEGKLSLLRFTGYGENHRFNASKRVDALANVATTLFGTAAQELRINSKPTVRPPRPNCEEFVVKLLPTLSSSGTSASSSSSSLCSLSSSSTFTDAPKYTPMSALHSDGKNKSSRLTPEQQTLYVDMAKDSFKESDRVWVKNESVDIQNRQKILAWLVSNMDENLQYKFTAVIDMSILQREEFIDLFKVKEKFLNLYSSNKDHVSLKAEWDMKYASARLKKIDLDFLVDAKIREISQHIQYGLNSKLCVHSESDLAFMLYSMLDKGFEKLKMSYDLAKSSRDYWVALPEGAEGRANNILATTTLCPQTFADMVKLIKQFTEKEMTNTSLVKGSQVFYTQALFGHKQHTGNGQSAGGGQSEQESKGQQERKGQQQSKSKKKKGQFKKRDMSRTKCYNCDEMGHFGRDCTEPDKRLEKEKDESKAVASKAVVSKTVASKTVASKTVAGKAKVHMSVRAEAESEDEHDFEASENNWSFNTVSSYGPSQKQKQAPLELAGDALGVTKEETLDEAKSRLQKRSAKIEALIARGSARERECDSGSSPSSFHLAVSSKSRGDQHGPIQTLLDSGANVHSFPEGSELFKFAKPCSEKEKVGTIGGSTELLDSFQTSLFGRVLMHKPTNADRVILCFRKIENTHELKARFFSSGKSKGSDLYIPIYVTKDGRETTDKIKIKFRWVNNLLMGDLSPLMDYSEQDFVQPTKNAVFASFEGDPNFKLSPLISQDYTLENSLHSKQLIAAKVARDVCKSTQMSPDSLRLGLLNGTFNTKMQVKAADFKNIRYLEPSEDLATSLAGSLTHSYHENGMKHLAGLNTGECVLFSDLVNVTYDKSMDGFLMQIGIIQPGNMSFVQALPDTLTKSKTTLLTTTKKMIREIESQSVKWRVTKLISDLEPGMVACTEEFKEMKIEPIFVAPLAGVPFIDPRIREVKIISRGINATLLFTPNVQTATLMFRHANYLKNHTPTKSNVNSQTPMQVVTGVQTRTLESIIPMAFGSSCVIPSNSRAASGQIVPRTIQGVFMGMERDGLSLVFSLESGQIMRSSSVRKVPWSELTLNIMRSRMSGSFDKTLLLRNTLSRPIEQSFSNLETEEKNSTQPLVTLNEKESTIGTGQAVVTSVPSGVPMPGHSSGVTEQASKIQVKPEIKLGKYVPALVEDPGMKVAFHMVTNRTMLTQFSVEELREAVIKEVNGIVTKGVFEFLSHDASATGAIPMSMLGSVKDGKPKYRLVASGNHQDKSQYLSSETSSPCPTQTVLMVQVATAGAKGWFVMTFDWVQAYLNAPMKRKVLVKIPAKVAEILVELNPKLKTKLNGKGTMLAELRYSLYGCVESARNWYNLLREVMLSMGYVQSKVDECNYLKFDKDHVLMAEVTIHVDDAMATASKQETLDELAETLKKRFPDIKMVKGNEQKFLGLEFKFVNRTVEISARKHTAEMLQDVGAIGNAKTDSPAPLNLFQVSEDSPLLSETGRQQFHSTVAKVLYLATKVRFDTLTAVSFLTTRVLHATVEDNRKLAHLLRYYNQTQDQKMILGGNKQGLMSAEIYVDASYDVHPDSSKSQSGVAVTLGRGTVYGKSMKQKIVTKSSTEAELVAASDSIPVLQWVREILEERGHGREVGPAILHEDNAAAITVMKSGHSTSDRAKHFTTRYRWIRQFIDDGSLVVKHCGTTDMVADVLTKPLSGELFHKLRRRLMGEDTHDGK